MMNTTMSQNATRMAHDRPTDSLRPVEGVKAPAKGTGRDPWDAAWRRTNGKRAMERAAINAPRAPHGWTHAAT